MQTDAVVGQIADSMLRDHRYTSQADVISAILAQLEIEVAGDGSTAGTDQKNNVPVKLWKGKKTE